MVLSLNQKPEKKILLKSSNFSYRKKVIYIKHKNCFNYEYKTVKEISKLLDLKIIIINARYSKYSLSKNVLFSEGPEEFLTLINNASFVCTDSFHGTAFSIIFQKDFITFSNFSENKDDLDKRREDLLKKVNLTNRLIYCNQKYNLKNL